MTTQTPVRPTPDERPAAAPWAPLLRVVTGGVALRRWAVAALVINIVIVVSFDIIMLEIHAPIKQFSHGIPTSTQHPLPLPPSCRTRRRQRIAQQTLALTTTNTRLSIGRGCKPTTISRLQINIMRPCFEGSGSFHCFQRKSGTGLHDDGAFV